MSEIVKKLRAQFEKWGVDAILVPHEDAYLNEYLPEGAEVLEALTGFTGSAGLALVTKTEAALFVDGRYTIQAKNQINSKIWQSFLINDMPPQDWAAGKVKVIGYDPSCFSAARVEKLKAAFAKKNNVLKAVPVGSIHRHAGDDQHPRQDKSGSVDSGRSLSSAKAGGQNDVFQFPEKYEGRDMAEKLALVRAEMKAQGLDAALIADPTMVSWLTGLRSHIIAMTPAILARAFVTFADVTIIVDGQHYLSSSPASEAREGDLNMPQKIPFPSLCSAGNDKIRMVNKLYKHDGIVGYDPNATPENLLKFYKNAKSVNNLFEKLRCSKTSQSRKIIKEVLRRDNEILDVFFKRLKIYLETKSAYEHEIAEMIAHERSLHAMYVEESFDAIVGFRENSAIIHYRPEKGSDKLVKGRGVLLIDCGAQYRDGTTDRTTTLLLGKPTREEELVYKTVVKAHKTLAATQFPVGTTGAELAGITNKVLWEAGYTCPHGIGHGVGQFLSVHEGPFSISPRGAEALPEGLLISNEPGVYLEGKFGVRHERLYFVERQKNGMLGLVA